MSETEAQISVLNLFNEKVQVLLDLSFAKAVRSVDSGARITGKRREGGTFEILSDIRGPTSEAIQAFTLTFRFFVQDNEEISLRRIARLYDELRIEPEVKNSYRVVRDSLNEMLDSANLVRVTYGGAIPTNREVMETFLYGGLAHANRKEYRRFKEWMSFPPLAVLMQECYNLILDVALNALSRIAEINGTAIKQLLEQNLTGS